MYVIKGVVSLIVMRSIVIILIRCVKIQSVIQAIVIILTSQGQITEKYLMSSFLTLYYLAWKTYWRGALCKHYIAI